MKYLIIIVCLIFVSFNVEAQPFNDLNFTQFNVGHPILCVSSDTLKPTLKPTDKVFSGMLNPSAVIEAYIDKDQTFLIIVHSISNLSCIYFMGTMGTLEGLTN